jgi:K+-sensing histidine kinase KdpD
MHVDADLIVQTLANLFDNVDEVHAAEHACTSCARPDDRVVRVTVDDEGPGCRRPADRLFDKFQRGGTKARRRRGLGLAHLPRHRLGARRRDRGGDGPAAARASSSRCRRGSRA